MRLQVKDIPQDLLNKINDTFEANPRIRKLRTQQQMLMRQGKFKEAMNFAEEIETLRSQCVYEYINETERQAERINVADLDMPIGDKERVMQLLLCCFMCADMIESSIIDMDSILHRHNKDFHVDMFDDMRSMMSMSKEKLKFLQDNSGYMKDLTWGDKCDDMYKMIQNKARSIMRKRQDNPDWGKNMERLNK